MDELDGYKGIEDFPSSEDARMGVIVGRYWKGDYRSALEVMVDVKGFIEERGVRVVNEDVAGLDLAGFGILSVETEGLDKSEGKNSLVA